MRSWIRRAASWNTARGRSMEWVVSRLQSQLHSPMIGPNGAALELNLVKFRAEYSIDFFALLPAERDITILRVFKKSRSRGTSSRRLWRWKKCVSTFGDLINGVQFLKRWIQWKRDKYSKRRKGERFRGMERWMNGVHFFGSWIICLRII